MAKTKEDLLVQAMMNTAKKHNDPEMMRQAKRAQKELDEKSKLASSDIKYIIL